MTQINHPDNKPDLDDYIEHKGTLFVTVQISYGNRVRHLEMFNRPPTFAFEDYGQTCFVGNINGGDSLEFRTQSAMMEYLNTELEVWVVEMEHNVNLDDLPPDSTPDYDSRWQEGHDAVNSLGLDTSSPNAYSDDPDAPPTERPHLSRKEDRWSTS